MEPRTPRTPGRPPPGVWVPEAEVGRAGMEGDSPARSAPASPRHRGLGSPIRKLLQSRAPRVPEEGLLRTPPASLTPGPAIGGLLFGGGGTLNFAPLSPSKKDMDTGRFASRLGGKRGGRDTVSISGFSCFLSRIQPSKRPGWVFDGSRFAFFFGRNPGCPCLAPGPLELQVPGSRLLLRPEAALPLRRT